MTDKEDVIRNWREMGLNLWSQFASYDEGGKTKYSNMALSALEDLEHALESIGLINKDGEPQWDALAALTEQERGR